MQLLKLALVAILLAACLTATGQNTDSAAGSERHSAIMATHWSPQLHRLTDALCVTVLSLCCCACLQ